MDKSTDGSLYLDHSFEGKPLVRDFIGGTMLGLEYLWGAPVQLETSEAVATAKGERQTYVAGTSGPAAAAPAQAEIKWERVVYTMKNRALERKPL
jgi:stage V sporulation protein R